MVYFSHDDIYPNHIVSSLKICLYYTVNASETAYIHLLQ